MPGKASSAPAPAVALNALRGRDEKAETEARICERLRDLFAGVTDTPPPF